jgi:hypothetical protein
VFNASGACDLDVVATGKFLQRALEPALAEEAPGAGNVRIDFDLQWGLRVVVIGVGQMKRQGARFPTDSVHELLSTRRMPDRTQ